jgi:aryl-alcohol dehydrogenase-like predicted oxidoreductase
MADASLAWQSTVTIGSDLVVNRLGYGAMKLTGAQVWGEYPDRAGGIELLKQVVQAGVNFIDTADVYGPHTNEILIHDALYPYPSHVVIATKGGFVRGGFDYATLGAVGNPNYLRQAAFTSARRLQVEQIDLYYLHSPQATDASFEAQVETLAQLKAEGVIRSIGLSNVNVEQFHLAQRIVEIAAVTAHYNVAYRTAAPLLKAAEQAGVVFSPWHPLTIVPQGADPAPFRRVLEPLAAKYGITVQQVALAWLLHRSPITLPIPGTTRLAHFKENLAAAEVRLTPEEVEMITQLVPEDAEG